MAGIPEKLFPLASGDKLSWIPTAYTCVKKDYSEATWYERTEIMKDEYLENSNFRSRAGIFSDEFRKQFGLLSSGTAFVPPCVTTPYKRSLKREEVIGQCCIGVFNNSVETSDSDLRRTDERINLTNAHAYFMTRTEAPVHSILIMMLLAETLLYTAGDQYLELHW